ncbi:MAG: hypothetical protein PHY31_05880 [Smithellaceae bacterium]|nr:hypothetical protein [Smithellaceae bacterium]
MRKAIGIICAGLLMATVAVPSWAADLIDVLKNKDILTQQEADQLRQETKDKEQKAVVLPPALQGLKFSATIFGDWSNTTYDHTSPVTNTTAVKNQFALGRAYLTLTKDINDWLGMNITTDFFNGSPDNGYELRLKYAYVNLNLGGTTTQAGMISTPSDAYDGAIWPYRMQGKHLMDDLGIQASADLGISNQGAFGGYMDNVYLKFASKQFGGKWGGWFVGVYNGAGYSVSNDANGNKAISGLIYLRPLPTVPVLKGLQIAYTGTYGKSNANFDPTKEPGTIATDYPDWQVNIGQVSLQHEYFTIMGQYYWGKATKSSVEDFSRKAYLVDAFVRIPGAEKVRVFGKYYTYDPNTDKDDDTYKTTVAGLSYDATKEFTPFVAWEKRTNDTLSPLASTGDYDKYQVGFQLKF